MTIGFASASWHLSRPQHTDVSIYCSSGRHGVFFCAGYKVFKTNIKIIILINNYNYNNGCINKASATVFAFFVVRRLRVSSRSSSGDDDDASRFGGGDAAGNCEPCRTHVCLLSLSSFNSLTPLPVLYTLTILYHTRAKRVISKNEFSDGRVLRHENKRLSAMHKTTRPRHSDNNNNFEWRKDTDRRQKLQPNRAEPVIGPEVRNRCRTRREQFADVRDVWYTSTMNVSGTTAWAD